MKKLLWIILWPLSISVGNFFDALTDNLKNDVTKPSDQCVLISALIGIAIWIWGWNHFED